MTEELKSEFTPSIDIVYLKTDVDQLPRLVTAYKVTSTDITYELACGVIVSWHYRCEISKDKNSLNFSEEIKEIKGLGKH